MGVYDTVLLPLAKVPAATKATVVMLVAPAEVGVTMPVLAVAAPESYETPVEIEPAPLTNVVDAADMIQPRALPRVSITPTAPSEPENDAAPGAPLSGSRPPPRRCRGCRPQG